jgi:hypothetical protein
MLSDITLDDQLGLVIIAYYVDCIVMATSNDVYGIQRGTVYGWELKK